MKSGSKNAHKRLIFLFSLLVIVAVAGFAVLFSSSPTSIVSPFLLARSSGVPHTIAMPASKNPTIISISPASGPVNKIVILRGRGFTSTTKIYFGTEVVRNLGATNGGRKLMFRVPRLIDTCANKTPGTFCTQSYTQVDPGKYAIYVQNSNGKSNSVSFEVTGGSNPTPTPTVTPMCYNGVPNGEYGCFRMCATNKTVCIDPPAR